MHFDDHEDSFVTGEEYPVGDLKERKSRNRRRSSRDDYHSKRRRSSTRESSSKRHSSSRIDEFDDETTGTDEATRGTYESSSRRRSSSDRRKQGSMDKRPSRRHSSDSRDRPTKGESPRRKRTSRRTSLTRDDHSRRHSSNRYSRTDSSRGTHEDDSTMEHSRGSSRTGYSRGSSRTGYSRESSRRHQSSRRHDDSSRRMSSVGERESRSTRDGKHTPSQGHLPMSGSFREHNVESEQTGLASTLAPAIGKVRVFFGFPAASKSSRDLRKSKSKGTIGTSSPTNSSVEDTSLDSESQDKNNMIIVSKDLYKDPSKVWAKASLKQKRICFGSAIFLFLASTLGAVFVMGKHVEPELVVTPAPTLSASPSLAPSSSFMPSDLPSMVPSDMPSNVPSKSSKPSSSPSASPSMSPSMSPSTSNNPTWTQISRTWDFKVRLQWQEDYFWQEEDEERFWCMECVPCEEYGRGDAWEHGCGDYRNGDNRNCKDGDSIWIMDCRNRGNRFNVLQIEESTSFMLRLDDTDLCIERRNKHLMFRVCNENEMNQQFVPWDDWTKFELRPLAMDEWLDRDADCVSQLHHPKQEEILGMHNCRLSRIYETRYWERYG